MGLTQRQLFEHLAGGCSICDVQYEGYADPALKRIPLVDLAIEIKLHGLPHFGRQGRTRGGDIGTGVYGPDREDLV